MQSDNAVVGHKQVVTLFEKGSPAILFSAVVLTLVFGAFLFPLPPFHTDLSEFSPSGPNDESEARIIAAFGDERRPVFVHVTSESGGNVLSIESLSQQQLDLEIITTWSQQNGHLVEELIAAPDIMQRALDESDNPSNLQSVESWAQLLNDTVEEGTRCQDGAADDELKSIAGFGMDALVHKDLQVQDTTCAWLDTNRTSGDPTPIASSTLWVLYINPTMDDITRQQMENLLRQQFENLNADADNELHYGLISNDLISHDINEGTAGNLIWLIAGALLVVVIILALAFRSLTGVVFPLAALSMALVWTYGALAAFESRFSVLEVAIAPVVLGLGIDYSIHLQRAYNSYRSQGESAAEAWSKAIRVLFMALALAVVTTMAAFIANVVSPLPPVRTFGLALAFGVYSAFITSTLVVGSMHVLIDREEGYRKNGKGLARSLKWGENVVDVQRRYQVIALLLVVLLTIGSVVAAAAELETEFDLGDFLDDDMEVMNVRDDLHASYEATGWRPIYIMMEPLAGQIAIVDDAQMIEALNQMNDRLIVAPNVVTPRSVSGADPMIEGIYTILVDAIKENPDFGQRWGMRVISNDLGTLTGYQTGNASAALLELSNNHSTADALTGATWSERVGRTVYFANGEIKYLRIEVMVQGSTNTQAIMAVEDLQAVVEQSSGKYGVQANLFISGDAVRLDAVLSGLTTSQLESTAISLLVSAVVLLALTRRLGPAVIVITPVAIAATWVVGSMAVLGLNWNVLTVMVTALTIGLGIDYSIHVWRRFETGKLGANPWDSLRDMHSTIGISLLLSAGTTICGFLVLVLSPMPVLQDFGIVTALTVFFSLVLAIGLLPILLAADSVVESNGD